MQTIFIPFKTSLMKTILRIVLLVMFISITTSSCNSNPMLSTVPSVDLVRYSGTWYSIASYPQFFERGSKNVRATYTPKVGYIEVYNQSTKDGKPNDIRGKAFIVDNTGNAKLKVQFFWPFKGNYWIIKLADDYSWAVVSDPKRKTLWVLSRTPKMDETLYNSILNDLSVIGFYKSKIVKMEQE